MTGEVFSRFQCAAIRVFGRGGGCRKRRVAEKLMLRGPFALSAQVLQEFIANALRKPQLGISEANIEANCWPYLQTGDCGVLYSEDMNHGQSYDGVRVVNPFL